MSHEICWENPCNTQKKEIDAGLALRGKNQAGLVAPGGGICGFKNRMVTLVEL